VVTELDLFGNSDGWMWADDREDGDTNSKRMLSSRKTIPSTRFSRTGFLSIEFLPQGHKYDSQFFAETVLPSIVASLLVCRPKPKARAARRQMTIAKARDPRSSIQQMEQYRFIRAPQPPYSPNRAPYDFFLFGHLKSQFEDKRFLDEDDVKKEVTHISTKTPITLLCSVIDEWVQRLMRCIERGGNYVS
jgi:hypothetical protein